MNQFDLPYTWYEDLYARDLGLECLGDGRFNRDAGKVELIARYYLAHPEHSRIGREMLAEAMLDSLHELLERGPAPEAIDQIAQEAVACMIADAYDRDHVRHYWNLEDPSGRRVPLAIWLNERFPGWVPPPSIWRQGGDELRE